jgi:hypothetical protein
MLSFLDAKTMAKTLRSWLARRDIDITLSESLELVAQQFGLSDWNVLAAQIARAQAHLPALPAGWYRTGTSDPSLHQMRVDPENTAGFTIESVVGAETIADRFASLGRTIAAADHRGGSVALSVMLKGEDCDRAFIWLRVDAEQPGLTLAFDNLAHRTRDGMLSGTFDWVRRSIVLPVEDDAARIVHGIGLIGTGRLWIRDIAIGPAERGADPGSEPVAA